MKGPCTLVASVLTASTVALSSSSSSSSSSAPPSSSVVEGSSRSSMGKNGVSDKEKFAPRFDGLRFIETLVTAHR